MSLEVPVLKGRPRFSPLIPEARRRIIVAMTGATGVHLGIKTILALRNLNVETHLILSKWAEHTIKHETDYTIANIRALVDCAHNYNDMAAPISSGSFRVDGMIVVPCSMKTLSAISTGYCDNLVARAADVVLKERRRLVLVTRESPLSGIHLQNMINITNNGGVIFPPVPAFYHMPNSIDEMIDQVVGRVLDLFDLDSGDFKRWQGGRSV